MRTWLIRFAPIVLAILQLALPRAAAADVEQCRDTARLAPRSEALPKPSLARAADARPGSERLSRTDAVLGPAPTEIAPQLDTQIRDDGSAPRRHVATTHVRLPQSRAPPTQS